MSLTDEHFGWLKEKTAKTGIPGNKLIMFALQDYIDKDGKTEKRRKIIIPEKIATVETVLTEMEEKKKYNELDLYFYIGQQEKENGICAEKQKNLATIFGCGDSTIRRWIAKLVENGFITTGPWHHPVSGERSTCYSIMDVNKYDSMYPKKKDETSV